MLWRPVTTERQRAFLRDSLTIALISDTHFGEIIGKKSAERFVALCNAQRPDIIIINGDIMDYESRFAERAHIEDDLRKLHAPLGCGEYV